MPFASRFGGKVGVAFCKRLAPPASASLTHHASNRCVPQEMLPILIGDVSLAHSQRGDQLRSIGMLETSINDAGATHVHDKTHITQGGFSMFARMLRNVALFGTAAIVTACSIDTIKPPTLGMPTIDPAGHSPQFIGRLKQCVANVGGVCREGSNDSVAAQRLHEVAQAATTGKSICGDNGAAVNLSEAGRSAMVAIGHVDHLIGPAMEHAVDGNNKVSMSISDFNALHRALRDSLLNDGWRKIQDDLHVAPANCRVAQDLKRIAAFVHAYFEAYFKDGNFFAVQVQKANLKDKLVKQIKDELGVDDAAAGAIADKILAGLPADIPVFGKIDDSSGFVTRGGDNFKAPTITAEVTPFAKKKISVTKIDTTA